MSRGATHMQGLIRVTEEGGESASPLSSSGAPNAGQLAGWGATSRGIGKMGLRSCGAAFFIWDLLYTVAGENCFCGGFVSGGDGLWGYSIWVLNFGPFPKPFGIF